MELLGKMCVMVFLPPPSGFLPQKLGTQVNVVNLVGQKPGWIAALEACVPISSSYLVLIISTEVKLVICEDNLIIHISAVFCFIMS